MNKKQQQEKFVKQLEDLLKRPENRNCADCGASGPRFASTNLGTFICTRCAGLHRKLGVHVTKVKSISHDAWTADQVQFMQQTGNKKAKEKYEYRAPRATTETDNAVYDWIRRKYELKEFLRPEGVIDTGSDDDEPAPSQLQYSSSSGIQAVPVPAGAVPPQNYTSPTGAWQPAPVPGAAPPQGQPTGAEAFMMGGTAQNTGIPSKAELLAMYNPPAQNPPAAAAPSPFAPQSAAPPGQIPVYMMGANGPVLVYVPASQLAAMQPVGQSGGAPTPVPAPVAAPVYVPQPSNPFGAIATQPTSSPFGQPQAASPFGQPAAQTQYGQPQSTPFGQPQALAQHQQQQQLTRQGSGYGQPSASPFGQPPAQQSSPFGQPPAQQGSPFGQPQAAQASSPFAPAQAQYGQPQAQAYSPFGQPQTGY